MLDSGVGGGTNISWTKENVISVCKVEHKVFHTSIHLLNWAINYNPQIFYVLAYLQLHYTCKYLTIILFYLFFLVFLEAFFFFMLLDVIFFKEKVMDMVTHLWVPVSLVMKLDNMKSQILSYVLFLWLYTFLLTLLKVRVEVGREI